MIQIDIKSYLRKNEVLFQKTKYTFYVELQLVTVVCQWLNGDEVDEF